MAESNTYAYIACRSHSGSTLLEMLLGQHHDVITVGEIAHFADYYTDKEMLCGCGHVIGVCPFWTDVLNRIATSDWPIFPTEMQTDTIRPPTLSQMYGALLMLNPSLIWLWSKIPGSLAAYNLHAMTNHWRLIQSAADLAQKRVIIDKSMSPSRLLEIEMTLPENWQLKMIHLVRDGRANIYSHMRKFGKDADQASQEWRSVNRRIYWITKFRPNINTLLLQYEDLCGNISETLQYVCAFLEIPYVDGMLSFRDKIQHSIGGNSMRHAGQRNIVLDQEWIQKLSRNDLLVFEKTAGDLNRKLGYK